MELDRVEEVSGGKLPDRQASEIPSGSEVFPVRGSRKGSNALKLLRRNEVLSGLSGFPTL
jgi:hypothetical protein